MVMISSNVVDIWFIYADNLLTTLSSEDVQKLESFDSIFWFQCQGQG